METAVSEIFCPGCGYDLQRLASDRCPECGLQIDRSKLGESLVPWIQRTSVGTYRAFWRTVYMATFRTRFLANEMTRPGRFADAVKFRRMVVLHSWVPMCILTTIVCLLLLSETAPGPHGIWVREDRLGSALQLSTIPVLWACLGLYFMAITGVCSYFFHPRLLPVVQQNRAIALSYYACAPLAYAPLTLALLVGGVSAAAAMLNVKPAPMLLVGTAFLIAIAPIVAQLIAVITTPAILLDATTHVGSTRQWALGIFLPIAWAFLAGLLLVVVPVAWATMLFMIVSFRH